MRGFLAVTAALSVLAAPMAPVRAQDPATVMAAVGAAAEVAIKLKSLFSKDDRGADYRSDLAAIREQNRITHAKLNEILTILGNLNVTVRQAVRQELQLDHSNSLIARIGVVQDYFAASYGNRRERGAAAERFRAQRGDIEATATQLMQTETYGYGHFDVLGHAMTTEFIIGQRLGESQRLRRGRAGTYAVFFTRVLDPTLPGSVGQITRALSEQETRLQAVLDAADLSIPTETYRTTSEHKRCSDRYLIHTTYKIAGDQRSGYTVNEVSSVRQNASEWCRGEDGPRGTGGGPNALMMAPLQPDPVDPGRASVSPRVRYLNATRDLLAEVRADRAVMGQAQISAQSYLDIALSEAA